MLRGVGLTVALLAAAVIARLGTASPPSARGRCGGGGLLRGAGIEDDKVIAARPHPTGSDAKGEGPPLEHRLARCS
jgi:hypothetical protein